MNRVGFKRETSAIKGVRRSSGVSWTRIPRIVKFTVILGALIALWQLCVALVDPAGVPGPPGVARALVEGWIGGGHLAAATWATLGVLAAGMFAGVALAVMLATFATWTRIGDDLLTLLSRTSDSVPAIAILPLLVLWLGKNPYSVVLIAVYAATWSVATSLRSGLKGVDPTIVMVGQNMGLRGWKMVRDVHLPAALPQAVAGARTGWAFCWRTVVAAGLVLGVAGENPWFFTDEAGGLLGTQELLAGLLNLAAIGILVEAAFGLLERRTIIRWGMKIPD